jgi:hypothetical protein
MSLRDRLSKLNQSPAVRFALFILGVLIMIIAPIIGLLPGPGGIVVFAFGLALALRSSLWAKRRYVDLKRWQPRIGGWADWGLRRPSAKRRKERSKREQVSK